MRIVVRLTIGLGALLLLAAVGLALALPRLLESPEVRATISGASEEQLGRSLEYRGLSLGFLPPSIVVEAPTIAGARPGDPPLLRAEEVSLRLALRPLFAGTVLLDSLVVSGAVLELARTEDGLVLPSPPSRPEEAMPMPEDQAPSVPEDQAPPLFDLAIRSFVVSDSSVILVDHTVTPPLTLSLVELNLTALGRSPAERLAFEAQAALGTGGTLAAEGTASLAGDVDLTLRLDGISLAALAPYASTLSRLEGLVSGEIALAAGAGELRGAELDLRLRDWALAGADFALGGEADLRASVPAGEAPVDFDIGLRLASGGAIRARGSAGPAGVLDARIDLDDVDLAPARPLLGGDAGPSAVAGAIELRGFAVETGPLAVTGELLLDELRLRFADIDEVTLRGRVEGQGTAVRLPELVVAVGGQEISASGGVANIAGDVPFVLAFESVGVLRANALFSAVTPVKDTVYGPLVFRGHLSGQAGPTGSGTPITDSLTGRFDFDLGRGAGGGEEGGRLQGVSVLRSALGGFDKLGQAVLRATAGMRGESVESFYSEEFQRMDGRFTIRGGFLESRNLRIVYRGYGVNLRGTVKLADQALDMTGEVQLGREVVGALGGKAGGRDLVIPLANVRGTVAEPSFGVAPEALLTLSQQLLRRNRATNEIGKQLEKIVPGLLPTGLGGLLGGGRR